MLKEIHVWKTTPSNFVFKYVFYPRNKGYLTISKSLKKI
jgi:hypothetical protein